MAEFVSEEEFKNIENKTHIIPNGIDKFWIENKAVETKKCPQNKKLKLLFVGRVQFVKNADILINVCRKLKEEGIEAELSIVGEMKERRYEKLFAKYDFVKYYPKCKKEELKKHYENADIFILLSHRETFGLVYAEAMSNALPIIYTRGQGFDGQFEDGTVGYACSSTDVNEAVEKVKKVLENYCELSENGRIMFEKFSWEKIASELEEIYEKTSGYIK